MQVIPIDRLRFEVVFGKAKFTVDLERLTCTCREFDLDQIPCKHALAAIGHRYLSKHEFCSKWYHTYVLKKVYEVPINPVGDVSTWDVPDDIKCEQVKAPKFKVKKGRMKKKRIKSIGEFGKPKRKCGNCKQAGHNIKTCNNPRA